MRGRSSDKRGARGVPSRRIRARMCDNGDSIPVAFAYRGEYTLCYEPPVLGKSLIISDH